MNLSPQEIAAGILELSAVLAEIGEGDHLSVMTDLLLAVADARLCMSRNDAGEVVWSLPDGAAWMPANKLPA